MTDLDLDLDGLSLDGAALGLLPDGRSVRVPRGAPGERVRVRVEHVARHSGVATARLVEVLRPSAGRRIPPCRSDVARGGRCTGCALSHLTPNAQRDAKRQTLAREHGLTVDRFEFGGDLGYRYASKRVAFDSKQGLRLGSYVAGTHRGASMRGCLVDHPVLAAVADHVEDMAHPLLAYDEASGRGSLRAVWMKTDGERALVTLVGGELDAMRALGEKLTLPTIAGVHVARARRGSNDLRGTEVELLRGASSLDVAVEGEHHVATPLGFLQPNPAVASRAQRDLVSDQHGAARGGRLAFDLYAGAGHVSRLLAQHFERVASVETHPESASALGVTPTDVAAFLRGCGDDTPDLVVANPPRAGMGTAACEALAEVKPALITLMSCHPASLMRDLALLESAGFVRVAARAYDTLPNTPHVELVVWLRRTEG